jgi:lon-related putative ATP-dependent protease
MSTNETGSVLTSGQHASDRAAMSDDKSQWSPLPAEDSSAKSPGQLLPLTSDRLYRPADLSALPFQTTADLAPIDGLVGQQRALKALGFGTRIRQPGFNMFVIGSSGARMQQAVEAVLRGEPPPESVPDDWVYVNNFAEPHKPIAIRLPAGRAVAFRDAMHHLIDDLRIALPAVFESEEYQSRRNAIDQSFQARQGAAFSELRDKAAKKNIVILRTPMGFALAPAQNGQVIPPDEFAKWPEDRRHEVQDSIRLLEQDLEHIVRQIPQWEKARRDEVRKLNRETAMFAVGQSIDEAKSKLTDVPRISEHLEAVRGDLVENVAMFIMKPDGDEDTSPMERAANAFERYEVNVLVTRDGQEKSAPIVQELHPTLGNLIGSIEYVSQRGVLVTNFRLIKAGAIHRANGGFLLIDVRHLLMEPFSWQALKRALRQREIRIEDVGRFIGLTSTVSLQPDPIPLNLKIVLFGDRLLYYLLSAFDPEIGEHFKVLADFEDDVDRSPASEAVHARLIASLLRRNGLKEFDRDAVCLVLEHAARVADHSGKLTLLIDQIKDLLAEADYWSREAGREVTTRLDVQRALDEQIARSSRMRDRAREAILQDIALIDTAGTRVGQVNGLSVLEFAGFRFGRPTRITCRVRPGSGKVVDIEREVELGGPIHSKGVLILSGFLAGRYALDMPMSLFASLVFEQSYGGVEGDSASSAELYALMSALSETPVRQDLAITGSVNQLGEVQAIGGVNEKIEGFFDVCVARRLTGHQGVLIPHANVQHLMLRQDIVDACRAGMFAVFAVRSIDDGIELLTGRPAGVRGADGRYPADSVNGLIEERLRAFARIRQSFAAAIAHQPHDERT